MAGTIKDTFDHAWNTIADLGPSAVKALYDNVPDYVKKLSPAAGGDKTAAGTMSDYISQYQGGGQYGYLRINDKKVGDPGPNGTVWNGSEYTYPGGMSGADLYKTMQDPNFGFVGLPAPIVVNIDTVNAQTEADARTAAGTIAYSLATAGMVA